MWICKGEMVSLLRELRERVEPRESRSSHKRDCRKVNEGVQITLLPTKTGTGWQER